MALEFPNTPTNGQVYIDPVSGNSYIYDSTYGTWKATIDGSTGFTGSRGFTGSQGFVGSQGDIGFTGSQGNIGFTGSQGFTGSRGDTGFVGSQGNLGFTGSIGFTGSKGIQGTIGFTGSQGTGGGGPYNYHNSNTTIVPFSFYMIDTSDEVVYVTLPTPEQGDWTKIADGGGDKFTNPVIVLGNNATINDQTEPLELNVPGVIVELVYTGTTWKVFTL